MQQAQAEAAMESHFDAVDVSAMQPGGSLHFTAEQAKLDPGAVLTKVCGLYRTVRPFISVAANFFLIPAKVKKVLKSFMDVMDGLCPES